MSSCFWRQSGASAQPRSAVLGDRKEVPLVAALQFPRSGCTQNGLFMQEISSRQEQKTRRRGGRTRGCRGEAREDQRPKQTHSRFCVMCHLGARNSARKNRDRNCEPGNGNKQKQNGGAEGAGRARGLLGLAPSGLKRPLARLHSALPSCVF